MVDSVGNRLGPRQTYRYIDDLDNQWNVSLDASVASAVGNDPAVTQAPAIATSGTLPFEARRLFVRSKVNPTVTKSIVITARLNPLFNAEGSQDVNINGVAFETTGIKPERRTFLPISGNGNGNGNGNGD